MERVRGVETEYGLVARGPGGRLSPAEAAAWMFRPIERHHRSSNAFLANGGRLYLDVGSHPEYATPECRTIDDLLVAERAGDEVMAELARRAADEAAAEGIRLTLRLFKNNVDSFGNSYGCHENYQVSRELDLSAVAEALTAFLVTRQILCGAGRWRAGEFLISQRADHLHDQLSATTTRARPLINTRDEPLADPALFRRLHVLAGDSNLSEPSARLKVGSTELVLRVIERSLSHGTPDLKRWKLADPADALRRVARNPRAVLTLTDGTTASAVALQRAFLAAVDPDPALADVTASWSRVLDALEAGNPDSLVADVEWAAKRRLLADFRARHHLPVTDPRLAQVDLAFHELGGTAEHPTGLFRLLESRGAARRLTTPAAVAAAMREPPADTRAALRSAFVVAAQRWGRDHSLDWMTFTVHDLPGLSGAAVDARVTCPDPLASSSAEVDFLIEQMATQPRVRPSSTFGPSPL